MTKGSEQRKYVEYLEAEWMLHGSNTLRSVAVRQAVSGQNVNRVLDVGAGAGQEMQPLVSGGGVLGIGVDISEWAAPTARKLYNEHFPQARVVFICATMENLPLPDNAFDVVICRLALPYADNLAAMREMARVLRPEGSLLVKLHHPRYYLRQLWRNVLSFEPVAVLHTMRILLSGVVFSLTGVHWQNRFLGQEVCQTRKTFLHCAGKYGLCWRADLADSNPYTPSLSLIKTVSGVGSPL